MPKDVGYNNEEKERKQRIKKLKARTSKMRLAAVKEKSKKKALEHYRWKNWANIIQNKIN